MRKKLTHRQTQNWIKGKIKANVCRKIVTFLLKFFSLHDSWSRCWWHRALRLTFFFFFTALENVIKSTKSGKLIGPANQKMVELLADNIKSGDPSSMLKMVGTPARLLVVLGSRCLLVWGCHLFLLFNNNLHSWVFYFALNMYSIVLYILQIVETLNILYNLLYCSFMWTSKNNVYFFTSFSSFSFKISKLYFC